MNIEIDCDSTEKSVEEFAKQILQLPDNEFAKVYMQTIGKLSIGQSETPQAMKTFHALCKDRMLEIAKSGFPIGMIA